MVRDTLTFKYLQRFTEELYKLVGRNPLTVIRQQHLSRIYPLEAMLSRSIYQHFMPEDHQRFTEFIQAAQSPESIYGEFTLRNQQGEPIPVHIGANALQFSQLLILGLVVTDLREHKRAEGELARLASIVTSSNDAIIGETLDGIITSWNRGAEKIFGYSADEVIQKPITILMPSENVGEDMVLMQKVVAGETVRNYDAIRLKKDGNAIFVSVSISPIKDEQGNIIGVSCHRAQTGGESHPLSGAVTEYSWTGSHSYKCRKQSDLLESLCRNSLWLVRRGSHRP